MKEFTYINGNFVPAENAMIHVTDLGLIRGYGVFDFFRAIKGTPVFLEEHLDRFELSTGMLSLKISLSRNELKENILKIIELNPHDLLGVKLICTGGYSEDGYTPTATNLYMLAKPFKFADYDAPLKLFPVEYCRDLSVIKTLNYVKPISILKEQHAAGAGDVLYHKNGVITESSRSNIFIVKNGIIITPEKDVLAGVTRKNIIRIAQENNKPLEIRDVTLEEVKTADEIFMSGSTKRIVPVTQVGDWKYPSGKITRSLYELLLESEKVFGLSFG